MCVFHGYFAISNFISWVFHSAHHIPFGMPQGLFFLILFSPSVYLFLISVVLGSSCLIPVLAFLITNLCSVLVCILAEVKGPSSQNWWTVAILHCLSSTGERSVVEFTIMQNRYLMVRSLFDKHLSPSFWKAAQLCLLSHCVGICRKKWER